MKIRRVTIEVEVPWSFAAKDVLECLAQGFDEIAYDVNSIAVPRQAQIVSDVLSPSTQIGRRA